MQEKALIYAQANVHLAPVYTKYFGEPLSQRTHDFLLGPKMGAVVEDVKQTANYASAVIRQHFKTSDLRTRYQLAPFGETWKIVRIDRECFYCRGTGQVESSRCQECDGEGWIDTAKFFK